LRNVNRGYDRCRDVARMTDRTARAKAMADIDRDLGLPAAKVNPLDNFLMGPKTRGEQIGRVVIGLLLPAIDKVVTSRERSEQLQRNLHLAFALAAYYADHGRYPAKLDELVPKHVDQIPDDIFSGKALIYEPEANGYLLYSVGANGIDEGGRSFGDDPPGDDLVIRMPAPEPKTKK
jgi:hypothetical protein